MSRSPARHKRFMSLSVFRHYFGAAFFQQTREVIEQFLGTGCCAGPGPGLTGNRLARTAQGQAAAIEAQGNPLTLEINGDLQVISVARKTVFIDDTKASRAGFFRLVRVFREMAGQGCNRLTGKLGALQGGIGWWMVASGLVDRPEDWPFSSVHHDPHFRAGQDLI